MARQAEMMEYLITKEGNLENTEKRKKITGRRLFNTFFDTADSKDGFFFWYQKEFSETRRYQNS
jgi:hypothetical protein